MNDPPYWLRDHAGPDVGELDEDVMRFLDVGYGENRALQLSPRDSRGDQRHDPTRSPSDRKNPAPRPAELDKNDAKGRKRRNSPRGNKLGPGGDGITIPPVDQLERLTVSELRQILLAFGVRPVGLKHKLIHQVATLAVQQLNSAPAPYVPSPKVPVVPEIKKVGRGGRREGAGRKRKHPLTSPSPVGSPSASSSSSSTSYQGTPISSPTPYTAPVVNPPLSLPITPELDLPAPSFSSRPKRDSGFYWNGNSPRTSPHK